MFRRKRLLRLGESNRLISQTEKQKALLDTQRELIARSIEPSEDVRHQQKITEAIYSFLIREAKHQHINKNEL